MADAVRKVAAILGGGPSLPSDLKRLPKDCTLISVNHHALRLCVPDYMVYMDDPGKITVLAEGLEKARAMGVKVIHPRADASDIALPKGEMWDGGFSSTFATWFALWMGFETVVLCGMDLYQGENKYFYERTGFYHPCFDDPLENHVRAWRLAFKHCPHPERIRAMSGPLIEVFGAFDG
jgi:hypothetical protein